jgi:hypothetical protein
MTDKKESISLASLMTPSKTVAIDFPGYDGITVRFVLPGSRRAFKA